MKRCARNEGSIFRRGDGRWVGVLDLGWENGARKRKHVSGATQAIAQEKLDEAKSDRREHLPSPNERRTVGEFLAQWLEESVKPSARPRTFESYSFLVEKHLAPALGRIPLAKLSPLDVQRLINSKIAAGKLSARTVRYMHAVLRSVLNRALEWHLIKRNVALRVRLPRAAEVDAACAPLA
jgi:integrase